MEKAPLRRGKIDVVGKIIQLLASASAILQLFTCVIRAKFGENTNTASFQRLPPPRISTGAPLGGAL